MRKEESWEKEERELYRRKGDRRGAWEDGGRGKKQVRK